MHEEISAVRSLYYVVRAEQYPRIGHRIVAIQNQILIFGGISPNGEYNTSIFKLDCETMTLDHVHTVNSLKLQGFSLFTYDEFIYFWGGSGPIKQEVKGGVCRNKLVKFVGNEFVNVQQKGVIPAARQYHASCMVSNKYLIIMGGNNGKSFFDDWHILQCSSMTWTQLSLNLSIPPILDAQLTWNGGRGFLLTGQSYDQPMDTLVSQNKLYEFRFSDFKQKRLELKEINVSYDSVQKYPRASPVSLFVNLQSPYLMLIGGTFVNDKDPMDISNTVQCFNLETLQWFSLQFTPRAGCGFEAIYSCQKIYIIGGLDKNKEAAQFVEYIEFKIDFLEAKVCKICREVYGMKQFISAERNTSIKFEAQQTPKTFFSAQIIGRMASYISYPFSAFGLLIDNSLNLSGTNIDIQFGYQGIIEEEESKVLNGIEKSLPYNYISIIDNSFGFTQHQIMECLCSFTVKTQKLTIDKRYEDEIEIKKEYGVNLKLGALRLGQSCLYMTKTEDRSKLFAYFSTGTYYSQSPFTICSYILTLDGSCSSEINRQMIRQNVLGKIPANYEEIAAPTFLFIFDLTKKEISLHKGQVNEPVLCYQESANKIYRYMREYLQSLYLKPFTGRKIALNGWNIKFYNYLQILKKDQQAGKLMQIGEEDYPKELFSCFSLYRIIEDNYFLRSILCYHKNRLIFALSDNKFCGVVELNEMVRTDICKTKIQNRSDELLFQRIIKSITFKHEQKRLSKSTVAKVGCSSMLSRSNLIKNQTVNAKSNDQNKSNSDLNKF